MLKKYKMGLLDLCFENRIKFCLYFFVDAKTFDLSYARVLVTKQCMIILYFIVYYR